MADIAVIGDRESVMGFKAIGFKTFIINDEADVSAVLKKLCNDDIPLVFICEPTAQKFNNLLAEIRRSNKINCVLIPGAYGNTGEGLDTVNKFIRKAIGSQL